MELKRPVSRPQVASNLYKPVRISKQETVESSTFINSLDDCIDHFAEKLKLSKPLVDILKETRYSEHKFDDIDKLDLLSYLVTSNNLQDLNTKLAEHKPRRKFGYKNKKGAKNSN